MVENQGVGEVTITSGGVTLSAEESGEGAPVVLLHGLTATRRYVVMGSRALQRSGHRVISYDARGHGRSSPAPQPLQYGYERLSEDLEAVLDFFSLRRAVLAGVSMGAHTLLCFALRKPSRVAGMVVITPAYEPGEQDAPGRLERWDALASGLRSGGVEGFLAAYGAPAAQPALHDTVLKVVRQRLALHEHPNAVADALQAVPRSRPFAQVEDLSRLAMPAAVLTSGDQADPGHPQRVGEAYSAALGDAALLCDEPGRSPRAWQGSQVSAAIAEVVARSGL